MAKERLDCIGLKYSTHVGRLQCLQILSYLVTTYQETEAATAGAMAVTIPLYVTQQTRIHGVKT